MPKPSVGLLAFICSSVLTGLYAGFHFRDDRCDHIPVILQICLSGDCAVSWNDFGLVVGDGQGLVGGRYKTPNVTTASHIDKGKADFEHEQITHVDDIRFGPVDERVAVGVGRRDMNHTDFLTIQMQLQSVGISDNGQRSLWRGRHGVSGNRCSCRHADPDIVMRHDHGPRLAEILVSAAMVEMPMRVDQELDRLRAQIS